MEICDVITHISELVLHESDREMYLNLITCHILACLVSV
jgi:hypothetical protein